MVLEGSSYKVTRYWRMPDDSSKTTHRGCCAGLQVVVVVKAQARKDR
jgi:hypothetical protein